MEKNKNNRLKFIFAFIFGVLLTIGLSISSQSLLAGWSDPSNNPVGLSPGEPDIGILVNTGSQAQTLSGPLLVNTSIVDSRGLAVINGSVAINTTRPDEHAQLQINASELKEGLRIVSASNYSPLNIRNSTDTADIFRVDQSGTLAVGSIPWQRLSDSTQCSDGEYYTVGDGGGLICSAPSEAIPTGFTPVKKLNRILGYIQTNPKTATSCREAMLDCNNAYGGRLPEYQEAYIALKKISGIGAITTNEWVGSAFFGSEKVCNFIKPWSYNIDTADYDTYLASYRCWVPTIDRLKLSMSCWNTVADAGPDQTEQNACGLTKTKLAAVSPATGIGVWSIISGSGGSIDNALNPNATFTGTANTSYILRWTVSNSPCPTVVDDVNIRFNQNPTVANAGADIYICNTQTSATLGGNSPTVGTGRWSVISGTAEITSPTLRNSGVTGLVIGQSATLRWTISNPPCASISDDVVLKGETTTTDIDGNVYDIIYIGSTCWMKQNLKTTKYQNGTPIPNVTDPAVWWALPGTGAYCWYNNDYVNYGSIYGALYNNAAVKDSNGLCPTGWHVSTNSNWVSLTGYLGGLTLAGGKLKEAGTTHWTTPNTGATNDIGFSALPGGYRSSADATIGLGGYWWTTDSNWKYGPIWYGMYYTTTSVSTNNQYRSPQIGYSVRCVR
jgi:uncharacterized protein (TIGR02145 family)